MYRSIHRLWVLFLALAVLDLAWRLLTGFALYRILPFEAALFSIGSLLLVVAHVRFPLPTKELRRIELLLAASLLLGALRALLWFVGGDVVSANLVVLSIFITGGLTLLVVRQVGTFGSASKSPTSEDLGEHLPDQSPGFVERWSHEIATFILVLIVIGATTVLCYQVWDHISDNAFITLRYAEHIQAGKGLTWNPSESPAVEGFESLSWILLLALAMTFTSNVVGTAKILSAILFSLCTVLIFFWSYRIVRNRVQRGIAVLGVSTALSLFLLTPGIPLVIGGGNESSLMLLAVTVFFIAAEGFVSSPSPGRALGLGAASAVIILTHPLLILVSAASLASVASIVRNRQILIRYAVYPSGMTLLIWYVWRTIRTEQLVPFPLNHLALTGAGIGAGLSALLEFLLPLWPLWIVGMLGAVLLIRRSRSHLVFLVGMLTISLLGMLAAAALPNPGRFFVLLLPPLALLTAVALTSAVSRFFPRQSVVVLSAVAIAMFAWHSGRYTTIRTRSGDEAHVQRHVYEALGRTLCELDSTGGRSIAIAEAGAVGFYSRWIVQNMGTRIGHQSPDKPHFLLASKPDAIALISRQSVTFDPGKAYDAEVYSLFPESGYKPGAVLQINESSFLWVFAAAPATIRSLGHQLQRRSGAMIHLEPEKKSNGNRR